MTIDPFYTRDGILKLLGIPGIDSKESISPAYIAWRDGMITPIPTRFLAPIDCSEIPTQLGLPRFLGQTCEKLHTLKN
jgi:hypothetical protein